jgi:hypothetical protein
MTNTTALPDFLAALRSGDIEGANSMYLGVAPSPVEPEQQSIEPKEQKPFDKAIAEELKSIRDMVIQAKQQNKIDDPATLKAIAGRHKELLSKLIEATEE